MPVLEVLLPSFRVASLEGRFSIEDEELPLVVHPDPDDIVVACSKGSNAPPLVLATVFTEPSCFCFFEAGPSLSACSRRALSRASA